MLISSHVSIILGNHSVNLKSFKTLTFSPKEALGVLDLRSLGYYKIWQGVLQQNLSKFYEFQSAENVCNQFNNLINTVKKEEKLDRRKIPMVRQDGWEKIYVR